MSFEHLNNILPADERAFIIYKEKSAPTSPVTMSRSAWSSPENLGTYAEAMARIAEDGEWKLGLAFTDHNHLIGIDLDDCYNPSTGLLEEWAENILHDLPPNSYAEISGGGFGIKVILKLDSKLDLAYKGTYLQGELETPDYISSEDGHNSGSHAEVFINAKYFALTGNAFGNFAGLEPVKMSEVRQVLSDLRGEPTPADREALVASDEVIQEAETNTCWTPENLARLLRLLPKAKADQYDNWFMIMRVIRNVAGNNADNEWKNIALDYSHYLRPEDDPTDKLASIWAESVDGSRTVADLIKKATTEDWVLYEPDSAMQIKQFMAELDFGSEGGIYSGGDMHNYRIALYLRGRAFNNLICVVDEFGKPTYYLRTNGVLSKRDTSWIKKTVNNQMNRLLADDPADVFRAYRNGFKSEAIVEMVTGMVQEYHQNDIDAEPYLLNVRNGVIDLNTGEFREHSSDDLFARQCPTSYDADATCPEFDKALKSWLRDDDLIDYAQRMIGMMLAGEDIYKKLLVVSGVTGSGKSTFCRAITNVLGGIEGSNTSYACKADVRLIQEGDKAANESRQILGTMRNRRITIISENKEGFKVSDTMLKQLTGGQGEVLPYRTGNSDWQTMPCSNSIIIETNFIPDFGSDLATQRRVRRISFDYSFEYEGASKKLVNLGELLKTESAGILNWMLAGYAKVRDYTGEHADRGLYRPAKAEQWDAIEATEDPFLDWLDERCYVGSHYSATAKELRESYNSMGNDVSGATFRDMVKNYRNADNIKFEYYKKGEHEKAKRSPVIIGIGLKPVENQQFGGF